MKYKCFDMKIVCIVFLMMLFFSAASIAQVAIVMPKPLKYEREPDGDLEVKVKDWSRMLWVVFSDRDNNDAYESAAEGAAVLNTVGYMDKFYVTKESGDFLELYKWKGETGMTIPGATKGTTQINPNKAERVGWIKKQNLLLWSKCLVNKQTHFSEKAMAVFNARNLESRDIKDGSIKIYSSPNGDKENGNTVKMFNLLYVYKKSGSRVLIGKTSVSQQYKIHTDILGWVDEVFLQLWPDRVCLEPNHDAEAVKARKAVNVKASLFYNKEEALAWKEGRASQPTWDDDSYEKHYQANQLRLPIFGQETVNGNVLINTGFQTAIFEEGTAVLEQKSVAGRSVMTQDELYKARLEHERVLAKGRQINIVFVIDAGYGMNTYADAIKTSISNLVAAKEEMNKEGANQNKYRYGAVVYRSDDDNACPAGDLSISKYPLTADARRVTDFISKEFQNEGCSSDELNKNTNNALQEALKMIKDVHKDSYIQSNIVFFLGSATGNRAADLQTSPALIAKYDVSLSVFQVKSADREEFERFPGIFKQLLKAAMEKKKENTATRYREDIPMALAPSSAKQNLFYLDFPEHSPVQGYINFPDKGTFISEKVIEDNLEKTVRDYEKHNEDAIDKFKTIFSGDGEKNIGALNALVKNYLGRVGVALDNYDLVNKFNGRNVQFFMPAWTTENVNKLENDKSVFKYVLYLTDGELRDVIDDFFKLIPDAPVSDQREMLYKAYESMVKAYFGSEIFNDAKFQSKISIDEIIKRITGLPSRSQLLKNTTLSDILDPAKVSSGEIEEIIARIRTSHDALKTAQTDLKNEMRNPTDDGTFYWIPQDYLP